MFYRYPNDSQEFQNHVVEILQRQFHKTSNQSSPQYLSTGTGALSTGPELFFLAQPKASNLELKCPTNMTLSERLLMVSNSLRFGFPVGQQIVAKMRFWLLERSMSITKASLLVMILKSMLGILY